MKVEHVAYIYRYITITWRSENARNQVVTQKLKLKAIFHSDGIFLWKRASFWQTADLSMTT